MRQRWPSLPTCNHMAPWCWVNGHRLRRATGARKCAVCRFGSCPPIERRGSHAMGHPAYVLLAWLRHATRNGGCIAAGTVVTTGTWVGILDVAAGDLVSAEFPGIGTASVQL